MKKLLLPFSKVFVLSFFLFSLTLVSAPQPAKAADPLGGVLGAAVNGAIDVGANLVGGAANSLSNGLSRAAYKVLAPARKVFADAQILVTDGMAKLKNSIFGALGVGACQDNGMLSDVICNVIKSTETFPGFITAIAYLAGIILAVTALLKLKDHVLNPNNTPLSDSLKRFVAGGAFFALPLITEATQNLLTNGNNAMSDMSSVRGYSGSTGGGFGLDSVLVALFTDIYAPLMSLIFGFAYLAGLVLVMVGIGRILKTAQDGPRGPAGMGTIMTFVVAGILFSLSTIMASFTKSMFDLNQVSTFAILQMDVGDIAAEGHILAIISTVLVFMTIIGYISFLRGFFIIKDVAEGSSQASLMAGVTHIFGGALAVNLGPLMNAVQASLGLDVLGLGVQFY